MNVLEVRFVGLPLLIDSPDFSSAAPSPVALTSTGRPPWTGNNTACSLSQYSNAVYVLDADASNPGVRLALFGVDVFNG